MMQSDQFTVIRLKIVQEKQLIDEINKLRGNIMLAEMKVSAHESRLREFWFA